MKGSNKGRRAARNKTRGVYEKQKARTARNKANAVAREKRRMERNRKRHAERAATRRDRYTSRHPWVHGDNGPFVVVGMDITLLLHRANNWCERNRAGFKANARVTKAGVEVWISPLTVKEQAKQEVTA